MSIMVPFDFTTFLACLVRIAVGVTLGGLIGLERQLRARNAGIRTNALVALGATLFVLMSDLILPSSGDPTRVAAQVASGVGFLGAGVILKQGASVSGLNSAATLWASAAVGVLAGAGYLLVALVGALAVMVSNTAFRLIANGVDRRREAHQVETSGHRYTFEVRTLRQNEVKVRSLVFDAVHRPGFSVRSIAASDLPDDLVSITASLDTVRRNDHGIEQSIEAVIRAPEVLGVRWDVECVEATD